MSVTQFVLMYDPNLGNRQARVPVQAIDDWALRGWLLVNGQSPAPLPNVLTLAAGDQRYLQLGDIPNAASTGGAALHSAFVSLNGQGQLVITANGVETVVGTAGASSRRAGALALLDVALATRVTTAVNLVFCGSSTTAGQQATAPANRWVNRFMAKLQADYPAPSGTEAAVVTSTTADFGTISTTAGLHGYNAGESGTTAATYLTAAEITKIAALNPRVIFHMVGSNDFANGIAPTTYKSQVLSAIVSLDSQISGPLVQVLIQPYERYDASSHAYPWSAYGQALADIAAANPASVVYLDISAEYYSIGVPGGDPYGIMYTDHIHQVDAGHALMTDLVYRGLLTGTSTTAVAAAGTTTPSADTTAPTVPSGVTATANSATQVALSWSPSTDAVGVATYRVRRNGANLTGATALTGTSFTDSTTAASTAYSYTVSAVDAAGNRSAESTAATVTTPAAAATGDTTAPTVPTNLTATPGVQQVALSWNASTDAVGVTGYRIRRAGTVLTTVAGTSYLDTGLTGGATYSYTVAAFDAANNESAQTAAVSTTPTAPTGGGPTLTRFTSDNFTGGDTTNIIGRTSDAGAGGTGQAWVGDASSLAITSSALARGSATTAVMFGGFAEPQANVEFSGVLSRLPVGGTYSIDIHRAAGVGAGTPNRYGCAVDTSGGFTLQKRISNVVTNLATAVTFAVGDRWALRYFNGTVELRKNGAVVASAADNSASLAGAGYCGFAFVTGVSALGATSVAVDSVS